MLAAECKQDVGPHKLTAVGHDYGLRVDFYIVHRLGNEADKGRIEMKQVLNEATRSMHNVTWDGNDLLYYYCERSPLPCAEIVERQREGSLDREWLTPAESALANQMWLIGRAYAASPERYSYTLSVENGRGYKNRHPGKPRESFLDTEGYESFFQDIARTLYRTECCAASTAYFRGSPKDLIDEIDHLVQKTADRIELIEALDAATKMRGVGFSDIHLCPEEFAHDVKSLREVVTDAQKQLRRFHESGFLAMLESLSKRSDEILFGRKPEGCREYVGDLTACVINFAKALNSARILRDATIVILTLRTLRLPNPVKRGFLENWASFSKGAKLLIKGTPSVSVSFSSKLLHFHCPRAFFIYDSISAGRVPKLPCDLVGSPSRTDAKTALEAYESKRRSQGDAAGLSEKEVGKFMDYHQHATQELELARFLIRHLDEESRQQYARRPAKNEDGEPIPHYLTITRLVDDFVMNGDQRHLYACDE